MSPEVRIETEEIRVVLTNEVIKREVLEGEKAEEARRKIAKAAGKSLRTVSQKGKVDGSGTGIPEDNAAVILRPVADAPIGESRL